MDTSPKRGPSPLCTIALSLGAFVTLAAPTCSGETEIIANDGIGLATDYYYDTDQSLPVVIARTTYGRQSLRPLGNALPEDGYAFVAQDVRGLGASGGVFNLFTDDGWGANDDGRDTVNWALDQRWSNGQGCVWGASALGISAYLAAGSAPEGLTCGFVQVGTGELFHHASYQGGALREELVVNWLLGLNAPEALDFLLAHPLETEAAYQGVDLPERYGAVTIPIYHYGGWYDIFSQGTLDAFSGLHKSGGYGAQGLQKLIMGPWTHGGGAGNLTFPDSSFPGGEDIRWFDYWLKGIDNGILDEAPVRYYMMGDPEDPASPGNEWRSADNWPLPHIETAFYLAPGAALSPVPEAEGSPPSTVTADPHDPVPTLGGSNLFIAAGAYDQSEINARGDVLLFQSAPLEAPLEVAGRLKAELFVSSSASDGDIALKLMDIYPDGRAFNVQDGILRLRFREGQDREVPMVPGEVVAVEVDLWSTAKVFNRGHRIGLSIAGSNSPRFEVNDNTGGPLPMDPEGGVIADHTIFHDAAHPSRLILPVLAP